MSLVELLEKDMIEAMKNSEKERLVVIRTVRGAAKQEVIDHKKEMNDELIIDVVAKQIKQRNESISEFKKGNRQDLVDKTQAEIEVLNKYLPEQLSEEEVEKIIDDAFNLVNPIGPLDMGKIMKEVQPKLKGKANMQEVSQIIKNKLSN